MAYKISGTILMIGPVQTIPSKSGSPLIKQDVVFTVRKFDKYTGQPTDDVGNTPKFTFVGEKCQQLSGLKSGDIVTVYFDIQGREFTKDGINGYFTDIRPFKIDRVGAGYVSSVSQTAPVTSSSSQPVEAPIADTRNNDEDPMPF